MSFAFTHFCGNSSFILFFFFVHSVRYLFPCIPSAHAGNQVRAASRTPITNRLTLATDTHLSQNKIQSKDFKFLIWWVKDILRKFSRDDRSVPFFVYFISSPCLPVPWRLCKTSSYVTWVRNEAPVAQVLHCTVLSLTYLYLFCTALYTVQT